MESDVAFQHFVYETVEGTSARREHMKNACAFFVLFQCRLSSHKLPSKPAHPIEQFLFIPDCVSHPIPYPSRYKE